MKRRTPLTGLLILCLGLSYISYGCTQAKADWPMLAHDVARTGATSMEIRPPFKRKRYRLFPDELSRRTDFRAHGTSAPAVEITR
jgi:hypothetical protein